MAAKSTSPHDSPVAAASLRSPARSSPEASRLSAVCDTSTAWPRGLRRGKKYSSPVGRPARNTGIRVLASTQTLLKRPNSSCVQARVRIAMTAKMLAVEAPRAHATIAILRVRPSATRLCWLG